MLSPRGHRSVGPQDDVAVREILSKKDDESVWMGWVRKRKREKVQDRLLVFSRYRVLSLKNGLSGKKQVQREGFYVQMTGIELDREAHRSVLRWADFWIECVADDVVAGTERLLAEYAQQTVGFPPLAISVAKGQEPLVVPPLEGAPLPAAGFLNTYRAFCGLAGIATSPDLTAAVAAQLDGPAPQMLDLTAVAAASGGSLALSPVFAALRHNQYYLGLRIVDYPVRDALTLLGDLLTFNRVVSSVALINVDAAADGMAKVASAIASNPSSCLVDLDLSGNRFGDRATGDLAVALASLNHGLRSLRLGSCGLSSKGLLSVLRVVRSNRVASVALVALDVSDCKLDREMVDFLAEWSTMSAWSELRLRGVGCVPTQLLSALQEKRSPKRLTLLDLGGNKFDTASATALATLLRCVSVLRYLVLDRCKFSAGGVEEILEALKCNPALKSLRLSFVQADLGGKLSAELVRGLSNFESLETLILRDAAVDPDVHVELFTALAASPKLVSLDVGMLLRGSHKKTPLAVGALVSFLSGRSALRALAVDGDGKPGLHAELLRIVQAVATNSELHEISLRNHRFGESLSMSLASAIARCTSLRFVNLDGCGLGVGAMEILRDAVREGGSLFLQGIGPFVLDAVAVKGAARDRFDVCVADIATECRRHYSDAGADPYSSIFALEFGMDPFRLLSSPPEKPVNPFKAVLTGGAKAKKKSKVTQA